MSETMREMNGAETNDVGDVVATLSAALADRDATIAKQAAEYERLRGVYVELMQQMALLQRRIFVATAERVDTTQLALEFAELSTGLNALSGLDGDETGPRAKSCAKCGEGHTCTCKPAHRQGGKGRRKLENTNLPVDRVEIDDPLFEQLVREGKAERIGFEESSKLGFKRGGFRRVVMARVKYRAVNARGEAEIDVAPVPEEVLSRSMATPATLAHILVSKYADGLPLFRLEEIFERHGLTLDRGTMSRWVEQLGASFGATVVHAAHEDAIKNAFCILTDATGFSIQPGPSDDGKRRPCRKGHYFVKIADKDHIFFEFTPKETSATVRAMFRGFEGYIQADAKSVYDALYRPPDPDDPDNDGCTRIEVACWAHLRRKVWEAALAKLPLAREALVRIGKIFEVDARLRDGNPPQKIKQLRRAHLAPLVDEFLDFAAREYEKVRAERGPLRRAFGYAVRQREALLRFLEDGRLRLDNNPSEAALRKVVLIRDSALFAGSDDHAVAAGHFMSLVASARLHGLEPEGYLTDLIRVLPYWPRDRFLELAPKYWVETRSRILESELEKPIGPITVPGPIDGRPG